MARPGLTTHRKFRRLARALGSPLLARGALELLWESCYESGDDYIGTAEDIESLVGWTGEAGALTRALVEAGAPEGQGFIEQADSVTDTDRCVTYRVHDLWHHAPDYVANRRSRENERRIEKACGRCGVTYHASDARSKFCSNACRQGGWRDRNESVSRNVTETDRNSTPAPAPAHTPKPKNVSVAPSASPTLLPVPVFLEFPIVGPDGPTYLLTDGQVHEWSALYPNLDVRSEVRKALAWIQANTSRRKTGKGMARFLVSWLSRAVDNGRAVTVSHPARLPRPDGGARCPHTPTCARWKDCTERILSESRAAS